VAQLRSELAQSESNSHSAAELALDLRDQHEAYVASANDKLAEMEKRARTSEGRCCHVADIAEISARSILILTDVWSGLNVCVIWVSINVSVSRTLAASAGFQSQSRGGPADCGKFARRSGGSAVHCRCA